MRATEAIKEILKEKGISQVELAERINTTKQNIGNKFRRDNFSALELVEIGDALGVKLVYKDGKKEYVIDYPAEEKGKPKRR